MLIHSHRKHEKGVDLVLIYCYHNRTNFTSNRLIRLVTTGKKNVDRTIHSIMYPLAHKE